MSSKALHRRVADLARRQAAAAEHHAATAVVVDEGHARRVAFLMRVPEDLRMAVGITLFDPDGDDALHSWALAPFARWAAPPPGLPFPPALVVRLIRPPRGWFPGHSCERCGLVVPLPATWANDPSPPSVVVFPACPGCGGPTSWAANWWAERPA